jgi:cell division protein FtsB
MHRLSEYARREWLSLILGGVLLMGLNAFVGAQGPKDLLLLRHHRYTLEGRRARLVAENGALRTNVQKLRSDRRYLERLVRRELGYARADELVYKFSSSSASQAH